MIPSPISPAGLATTSLLVSALIAVFLPLRPLLRRMIGSQWLCVLWIALLARLLMPWPVESRWSLYNHWQSRAASAVVAPPLKIKVSFPKETSMRETHAGTIATPTLPSIASSPVASPAMDFHWDLWYLAGIVWLAGVAFFLGMLPWRWLQTRGLAAKTRPATDTRLQKLFESIPRELRRDTQLRMTDALAVPTLAGIFHPQIWMPLTWPAQFTDEELRNVLLHELGHARRRDLLVQWVFAIVQCIHWFNPLVWLAARSARFDREMACDAWVLARNDADHSGYGSALMKTIQLLRSPLHTAPATVAMASNRRSLRARISGIGTFRATPAWRGVAGVAAMVTVLAAVTTSRTPAQDATPGEKNATPPASTASSADPRGRQFHVTSKFVMITEEAWKKLCAENPDFKDFAGKLPELDTKKEPVADVVKGLNDSNLKKGAWEVSRELKLLAPLSTEKQRNLIAAINKTKGASLLSTPSVTTRAGQKAVIEMVQEFRYTSAVKPSTRDPGDIEPAEFITQNMGITLEAASGINKDGNIDVQLTATMEGCLGFLLENKSPRNFARLAEKGTFLRPLFSVSTGSTSVSIPPSGTVLLGGVTLDNQSTDNDAPTDDPVRKWTGMKEVEKDGEPNPETVRHVLLVFATAEIAAPPAPVPQSKEAQVQVETKFAEITEEAWKKMRAENPSFTDFKSNFPELAHEKPTYSDVADTLTQPEKGAWEIPGTISLLSVLSGDDMIKMIKSLDGTDGANLLSAPSFTAKNNWPMQVAICTEFRYPSEFQDNKDPKPVKTKNEAGETVYAIPPRFTPTAFLTKNVGVSLEATPKVNPNGSIDLALAPALSDFLGFATDESGVKSLAWNYRDPGRTINRPVFSNLSGTTSVTIEPGKTLLLGGVLLSRNKDFMLKKIAAPDFFKPNPDATPETFRHVMLVFVTAKIADPDQPAQPGHVSHVPSVGMNEVVADPQLPSAIPVNGKPGFVNSPYNPTAGDVDVRGFAKGTEVKDPYTGKIFLVP